MQITGKQITFMLNLKIGQLLWNCYHYSEKTRLFTESCFWNYPITSSNKFINFFCKPSTLKTSYQTSIYFSCKTSPNHTHRTTSQFEWPIVSNFDFLYTLGVRLTENKSVNKFSFKIPIVTKLMILVSTKSFKAWIYLQFKLN